MNEQELYKYAIKKKLANNEEIRCAVLKQTPKFRRWPLIAAACLTLGLALTMLSPTARAAVSKWFDTMFDAGQYIGMPREERTPKPALESIISHVEDQAISSTAEIVFVKEGWEKLASGLEIKVDEILYDGQDVFISGEIKGNSRYFYAPLFDTGLPPRDCQAEVVFTIKGHEFSRHELAPVVPKELSQMVYDAPQSAPVIEFLDKNHFRFTARSRLDGLTGNQVLDLEFQLGSLYETHRDSQGTYYETYNGIKAQLKGLTFDASAAANMFISTPAEADIKNSNITLRTIEPISKEKKAKIINETKSLSGGKFFVEGIQKRVTGIDLVFAVKFPDGWTKQEIDRLACEYIVAPQIIINGKDMGGVGVYWQQGNLESDDYLLMRAILGNMSITQEDWANIETFEIQLAYVHYDEYNGVKLVDDAEVIVPYDPTGWNEDSHIVKLDAVVKIPISKIK